MNSLITQCIMEGDLHPLVTFPIDIMSEIDLEIVTWVLKYRQKYSRPPTIERIEKKFPHFIRGSAPIDPIQDTLDQTVRESRSAFTLRTIHEIENEIIETGTVPEGKFSKLNRILAASSGTFEFFSKFSRDSYETGSETSLNTGISKIDKAIGGFQNGDYGLVAGRLGSKKTTLTMWLTYNWWRQGARVFLMSREMATGQLFGKIDAMLGKFNPHILRSGVGIKEIKPRLKVIEHIAGSAGGEIIVPSADIKTPSQLQNAARFVGADVIVVETES